MKELGLGVHMKTIVVVVRQMELVKDNCCGGTSNGAWGSCAVYDGSCDVCISVSWNVCDV